MSLQDSIFKFLSLSVPENDACFRRKSDVCNDMTVRWRRIGRMKKVLTARWRSGGASQRKRKEEPRSALAAAVEHRKKGKC